VIIKKYIYDSLSQNQNTRVLDEAHISQAR